MKNTFYAKEITLLNYCGKTIGLHFKGGAFERPVEVEATVGQPHDFNNCNSCRNSLVFISDVLKKRFNGDGEKLPFPLCCPLHFNLAKLKGFDRNAFINVPEMVARKVIYTNQHIINNIDADSWYKEITDYIESVIESFGQMPPDCGEPLYLGSYFDFLIDKLQRNPGLSDERKGRIMEYLNACITGPDQTDLNILIKTYEKWLKTFPFNSSYFNNLKQHFERELPILTGEIEINKYSGKTKFKLHTESSLVDALVMVTKRLLHKLDTDIKDMLKQGIISDFNKHTFELATETLLVETSELTKEFSNGELKYVSVLKKWLQMHREFFFKFGAWSHKALPIKEPDLKTKATLPAIALFCSIVHQSRVMIRGFESNTKYCGEVCKKFNIAGNPNKIRQHFSEHMQLKKSDKNLKIVTEFILPTIEDQIARETIIKYIESKNLYQ